MNEGGVAARGSFNEGDDQYTAAGWEDEANLLGSTPADRAHPQQARWGDQYLLPLTSGVSGLHARGPLSSIGSPTCPSAITYAAGASSSKSPITPILR